MKTIECVRCKRIFDCAGKLTDAPCVCFEERDGLQTKNSDRKEEQRNSKEA